jgi:hypothetical protein
MTEEEIVYDIMMEAEGFQLGDDARWNEYDYVAYKLREKRAKVIRDGFRRNNSIHGELVQNLHDYEATKVNAADDFGITLEMDLGKIVLPEIVGFHDDTEEFSRGLRRFSKKGQSDRIYQTSKNKFFDLIDIDSDRLSKYTYFFRVDNDYFIYPYFKTVQVSAILANPLDGFVQDTMLKTTLVNGTDYTVITGSILHNSINYQAGETFTAAATTFTGSGEVRLATTKRAMVKTDPYPLNESMMNHILEDFVNKEFRVQNLKSDSRNDSADREVTVAQE